MRRAYATLGLEPGASPGEIRKKFKSLVKQWHPDRFLADPVGQAEATARMRMINAAYRTLRDAHIGRARPEHPAEPAAGSDAQPASPGAPAGARPTPRSRLDREEIERMVNAIGREGPIDEFLGTLDWYAGSIRKSLLGIVAVVVILNAADAIYLRSFGAFLRNPALLLALAGAAYLLWLYPERGADGRK
jgi:hypothetical protein